MVLIKKPKNKKQSTKYHPRNNNLENKIVYFVFIHFVSNNLNPFTNRLPKSEMNVKEKMTETKKN